MSFVKCRKDSCLTGCTCQLLQQVVADIDEIELALRAATEINRRKPQSVPTTLFEEEAPGAEKAHEPAQRGTRQPRGECQFGLSPRWMLVGKQVEHLKRLQQKSDPGRIGRR